VTGPAAFRRAADTIEAVAIGDEKHAGLVLIARFAERYALGTACEDEAAALGVVLADVRTRSASGR
jgi:hypothetical protein